MITLSVGMPASAKAPGNSSRQSNGNELPSLVVPVGATPVFKHELAPGNRRLRFVRTDLGLDEKREVRVRAGHTEKRSYEF